MLVTLGSTRRGAGRVALLIRIWPRFTALGKASTLLLRGASSAALWRSSRDSFQSSA